MSCYCNWMSNSNSINGRNWLHELMYGTEKTRKISEEKRELKGKSIDFILQNAGCYSKNTGKLDLVKMNLAHLLGKSIEILDIDDGLTSGSLKSYDLNTATITVVTDNGLLTQQYCSEHRDDRVSYAIPLIGLRTDTAFKY